MQIKDKDFWKKLFRNKRLLLALLAVMILVFTIVVGCLLVDPYYRYVQPIVTLIWPTPEIHTDIDLYSNKGYLEFELGDMFYAFLERMGVADHDKVAAFYHIDNRYRDNPVYGKYCDFFAIDLVLDPSEYLAYKEDITGSYMHCGSIFDYELYFVRRTKVEDGEWEIVAISDTACTVRFIYATYVYAESRSISYDYASAIYRNTTLNWIAPTDEETNTVP